MGQYLRSVGVAVFALILSSTSAWATVSAHRIPVPPHAAKVVARNEPVVEQRASGCFSDRGFRRIIRQHLNEVRYCYQQALQQRSELAGHEVLQLTITTDGAVAAAVIVNDELHAPALAACVVAAAARWQFLPTRGTGLTVVTYPFMLQPAGATQALVTDAAHQADLRACYEQALWRHLGVGGSLALRITLDETAHVRFTAVTATTICDDQLLACITSAVKRWQFADTARSTTFEKTLWLQPAD